MVLVLLLLLVSSCLYLIASLPAYHNIPVDSIYSSVGPWEEAGAIQVRRFTFTVYVATNIVEISGDVDFGSRSGTHYLDFYLPYIIYDYTNSSGSDVDLYTRVYPDTVDGKSSLMHVEIRERGQGWHGLSFRIHTSQLVAVSQLGEDRLILTFGNAESSYRLIPLNRYREEPMMDISQLTPLTVMAVTNEHHFFSSDCYPSPSVEYLTANWRIATWQMNFSGYLSNYYRSIDCTIVDPWYVQVRQVLIFVSGSAFSLGITVLVSTHRKEIAWEYLLYRRIRRRALQLVGKWRK